MLFLFDCSYTFSFIKTGTQNAFPSDFLKMRSANKVSLVNTVYGAGFGARATACTKRIIYCCKIVYDLDCPDGDMKEELERRVEELPKVFNEVEIY